MKNATKKLMSVLLTVCMLLGLCAGMAVGVGASDIITYTGQAPTIIGVTFTSSNKTSTMLQKYKDDNGVVVNNPAYQYTYPVYSATYTGTLSVSNSTGYVQHMKTGHPRLLTNDFSQYVDNAETDFTAKRLYAGIMKQADNYLATDPYEFYMNIRDNINDFSGNIEDCVVTLAMAYNLQKVKVQRGDADAVVDYEKYADRAILEMLNAAQYPHWSQNAYLCTAEISTGFAFGYDWLYDYLMLPKNAEALQTIKDTIYKMSLVPYAWYYSNGKYWETNNWNEVCNGSGIITALAFYDANDSSGQFSEICEYILESAAHYLHKGLVQYQDDGFFREGIGYWSYATEYLIRAIDAYQNALADNFVLPQRFQHINVKGVKQTAEFPIYMNGITGTLNFGDCASGYVYSEVMYWFAKYLNKPEYAAYLNSFMLQIGKSFTDEKAVYALIWYEPQPQDFGVLSRLSPDKAHVSEDDLNILTLRKSFDSTETFVGMHGGDFDASHNGMSLGSFVLDMNGKRFVSSLGAGNYAWPGYFSVTDENSQRYTYYCMRSEGNNTLIFDPGAAGEQKKGSHAKIIDSGTSRNVGFGILNLTSTHDNLKKHYRGIMLADDRRRVIVQDEFEAKSGSFKDVYWFAHTGNPETKTGANVVVAEDGKSAVLTIDNESIVAKITKGPADAKFEWVQAEPLATSPNPPEQKARMEQYGKKLRIHLTNVSAETLRVEFSPADMPQTDLSFAALADWSTQLSDEIIEPYATYINQKNYETDWYKPNYSTYYIHDDKDLAGLAYMVNNGTTFEGKLIKLVNDIKMDDVLMWVPIGTDEHPFKGIFDGSQREIDALKSSGVSRNAGLFGALDGATVKNLLMKNATVSCMNDAGVLAGMSVNSKIYNVFVQDCLVCGNTRIGGIVGTQIAGSIINTGMTGKVFGQSSYYGGIVGYTTGIVDNCMANIQLCENKDGNAPGSNIGGVAGISAFGDIKNSYYRYDTSLVTKSTKPYNINSANAENSCGKFIDTSLAVQTVSMDTKSELKYKADNAYLVGFLNAWIDDPENNGDYIKWQQLNMTSIELPAAILEYVPETVIDENNNKNWFEISNVSVANGKVNFEVQNEKYGVNTGYLVVVQTKTDGSSKIDMLQLNMESKENGILNVDAQSDVSGQIFVLDSFFNMKIKSNILKF